MLERLVLAFAVAGTLAAAPARAAEAWVGRWAINPTACSSFGDTLATAPLIVTDTTLRWIGGACRIGKMYKLGPTAYIQARCFGETASDIPVRLDPRGDRMRVSWNGAKTEEMRRCK